MKRSTRLFTAPDAWHGGSFDLLVHLRSDDSDLAQRTLSALWSHVSVSGCWLDHASEPTEESRAAPSVLGPEDTPCYRGIAHLPNETKAVCSSSFVWDDDGIWLYFGVPLGSLGRCYNIGAYPFERAPVDIDSVRSWALPMSDWLADIAKQVFSQEPFSAGIIGFLSTADVYEVLRIQTGEIPDRRYGGYLKKNGEHLNWHPPNTFDSPCIPEKDS